MLIIKLVISNNWALSNVLSNLMERVMYIVEHILGICIEHAQTLFKVDDESLIHFVLYMC